MDTKASQTVETALNTTKFTIDELTVDLSAFLQFLFNQSGSSKIASYWSLIPDSLEVKWSEKAESFFLKKNLQDRKIYIYAKPVEESLREQREATLLGYFHNIIAEEQIDTVTLLMSKLKTRSREKLKQDFLNYKKSVVETK